MFNIDVPDLDVPVLARHWALTISKPSSPDLFVMQ